MASKKSRANNPQCRAKEFRLERRRKNKERRLQEQCEIARNPIKVAQECRQEIAAMERSHNKALYHSLRKPYVITAYLLNDREAWGTFLNDPFFAGTKQRDAQAEIPNAARHVLNFVFDARSETARKRTGKYASVLNMYLDADVSPNRLVAQIEKDDGIENAYDLSVVQRKMLKLAEHSVSKTGKSTERSKNQATSNKYDEEENDQVCDRTGLTKDLTALTRKAKVLRRPVELRMKVQRQERLLALAVGERRWVEVLCRGRDDSGWVTLRAVKVRRMLPKN